MEQLKVLQLFDSYPGSNTTNWLFSLMVNTPNCKMVIGAKKFTRHNFYSEDFIYIENPAGGIVEYERSISKWSLRLPQKFLLYIAGELVLNYKRYLCKAIVKMKIDIVHAHFADVGCDYASLVKKMNLPLVVSFYGYDYEYLPYTQPEFKHKYLQLFSLADKILCEGSYGASVLEGMGCPKRKIEVVKLGVETSKIFFKERKKPKESLRLLQIASLREKKGHIYTLKAFHAALSNCPSMHLTMVGNGDPAILDEINSFIRNNKLSEKVELKNEIDFSKLHHFISEFDVFIHPSCYSSNRDCEGGAPVVLLDAQACGVPVISTKHCDIPDEVLHGKTGLLSPEKDIASLSESITIFYRMNEQDYSAFSRNARLHIEEKYSVEKNAIHLKRVYDSLEIH